MRGTWQTTGGAGLSRLVPAVITAGVLLSAAGAAAVSAIVVAVIAAGALAAAAVVTLAVVLVLRLRREAARPRAVLPHVAAGLPGGERQAIAPAQHLHFHFHGADEEAAARVIRQAGGHPDERNR